LTEVSRAVCDSCRLIRASAKSSSLAAIHNNDKKDLQTV
jgi:hypothetical protein